jgi:signal transduction histidine kinase
MQGEIPGVLAVASGLISLALGFYVYLNGRHRLANNLFLLMTFLLAIWAFGEALTIRAGDLEGKIFWSKFQGIGEAPLIPTYLLIALYFPRPNNYMRSRRKAAAIITAIYAPFVLTIVLLYTSNLVYSEYFLSQSSSGISVTRTPVFWAVTALAFAEIPAASVIYLRERRRTLSRTERMGLLIMALAPLPMLLTNVIQNLRLNPRVNTLQSSLVFIVLIGYGILRYGIFVDVRSITKRLLVHVSVVLLNLTLFTALCAFYVYGLDLGIGLSTYILFVLTGLPFMLVYQSEVERVGRIADRYFLSRELKEARLLQELSRSIRTLRNLQDLTDSVVGKVRESMSLTACTLMVKSDGLYRLVGYSCQPNSYADNFKDMVECGVFLRKWSNWFVFEDEAGVYSGYWQVGERIHRGESVLSHIVRGVLRIHSGGGELQEMLWREEEDGETISVPLEVGGEEVGFIWLVGRPVRFSLQELDFIVALSTQVAVSLKNSQLLQELLDKSTRLQQLIHKATTAQEEERIRISRELHDGLVPYFMDIIFRLEILEDEISGNPAMVGLLDEVKHKAREGFRDLREVIADLRPSSLDVLERFGVENGIEVEYHGWGDLERLDPLIEVTIFRVAQETLSNISRHAHAGEVKVSLGGENGYMEMTVEDNGVGFSENDIKGRVLTGECLGIKGMRERAELMQGELKIESHPGCGTKVIFSIPLAGI